MEHSRKQLLLSEVKMQNKTKIITVALVIIFLISPIPIFNLIHGQLTKPTPTTPIRVACVGDSITALYPAYLYAMLGSNKYSVGNFGVGGSTVSLDFDKPYMNQTAATNALNFAPDIVVIMLGTNDGYLEHPATKQFHEQLCNFHAELTGSHPNLKFHCHSPPAFNNTTGLNGMVVKDDVTPLFNQTAKRTRLTIN